MNTSDAEARKSCSQESSRSFGNTRRSSEEGDREVVFSSCFTQVHHQIHSRDPAGEWPPHESGCPNDRHPVGHHHLGGPAGSLEPCVAAVLQEPDGVVHVDSQDECPLPRPDTLKNFVNHPVLFGSHEGQAE